MTARKITDRQEGYIMHLLARNGYGNEWMSSSFKRLGATMKERSGRVEDWLDGMSRDRASNIISALKAEAEGRKAIDYTPGGE